MYYLVTLIIFGLLLRKYGHATIKILQLSGWLPKPKLPSDTVEFIRDIALVNTTYKGKHAKIYVPYSCTLKGIWNITAHGSNSDHYQEEIHILVHHYNGDTIIYGLPDMPSKLNYHRIIVSFMSYPEPETVFVNTFVGDENIVLKEPKTTLLEAFD